MATNTTRARPAGLSRLAQFAGIGKPRAADDDTTEKPEDDTAPATPDDLDEVQDDVDDVREDVEDVEDDVDELEQRVSDLEDDGDEEPEEDPDAPAATAKPAERKAYRGGVAFGAKKERARIKAIMGCPAAASSPRLAVHYAFNTGSTAKEAVSALSAAAADGRPAAKPAKPTPKKSALDERMDGTHRVAVGSGAPPRGAPATDVEMADGAVALARGAGMVK